MVLLHENLLQRPVVEPAYASQMPRRVEVLLRVFSREGHVSRHATQKFHHLSKMVIVFVVVVALSWLEQEVARHHFENSARKGPHIGACIIVCSNDDLRGAILSCLDLWSKVVISPAAITHIAYLYHHVFINLRPSLALFGLRGNILFFRLVVVVHEQVANDLLSITIDGSLLHLLLLRLLSGGCSLRLSDG